jgi:hypothetical protein
VKPAVVSITAVHVEKFQAQENPFEFFFWDPDEMFEQFFNAPSSRATSPPPGRTSENRPASWIFTPPPTSKPASAGSWTGTATISVSRSKIP